MWSWNNFFPHRHQSVRRWVADNDVELVFLPTYGSWLNWIEFEVVTLQYFALNGIDHRSHAEQSAALAAYVRTQCENPVRSGLTDPVVDRIPALPGQGCSGSLRGSLAHTTWINRPNRCVSKQHSVRISMDNFENRVLQPMLMADETARRSRCR
ncbi:hypothetical protein KUG88_25185 [Rhodococcus rhodochrous]|uniref:hypothetical protein n=1 Tax=Rhodococcus rhodochrous TaxID=1829 RepID=UPI001E33521D|nr:hypothetical protein [Rhodococcus rhodochrous]MCB8913417.1 hypothetical protein [Rhodococcus rhodochrous]